MVSVTSWLIVHASNSGTLSLLTIWLIAISSIALSILAALAFSPVETLTKYVGDTIVKAVVRIPLRQLQQVE